MGAARAAVLVVEDDAELRDWIASELTSRNFAVKAASSGPMAIEVQAHHRFDLALIDLRMPGMDGIQTLTALKENDPELEAVIATGHATIPAAVSSMKQGAFDFIQKPFTLRQLLPLLERALEKSRMQGTLALREAGETLLATPDEPALFAHAAAVARRKLRVSGLAILSAHSGQIHVSTDPSGATPDPALATALTALVTGPARAPDSSEPAAAMHPFGSTLVSPLNGRHGFAGRIVLLRDRDAPAFTTEDLHRASVFCDQLGHALDDIRLHEELRAKVNEVMRTRDALIFAEKLALTGQLTAAVAHEINTPLTFVRFNLDFVVDSAEKLLAELASHSDRPDAPLLSSAREAMAELRTAARDALEGVKQIVRIVRGLSIFAQPERDEPGRIELAPVLDWAVQVAESQVRSRARLVKEYEPVHWVVGSESRLCQVFVNLLVNATHAIPEGHPNENRITVRLRSAGGQVVAEVSDSGCGIEPEAQEKIFEPFFTTKPTGIGTGLGLSISRTIIAEHRGTLTVESAPGVGSTFRVTLPAADELTPPARSTIFRP